MLTVQIDEIRDAGLHLEGHLVPADLPALKELCEADLAQFPDPVHYRIDISRIADIIEVDGNLDSTLALSCGRCLEPYKTSFSARFSLAFTHQLPDVVDDDGEDVELSAEELGLILIETDTIDLTEPLQEQVMMALPIQPLCSESCRGLCPQCGINLNSEKCGCSAPVFDTRFAALKDFKVKK